MLAMLSFGVKCNFLKWFRIMLLPHEIAKIFHQSFKDGHGEIADGLQVFIY